MLPSIIFNIYELNIHSFIHLFLIIPLHPTDVLSFMCIALLTSLRELLCTNTLLFIIERFFTINH